MKQGDAEIIILALEVAADALKAAGHVEDGVFKLLTRAVTIAEAEVARAAKKKPE